MCTTLPTPHKQLPTAAFNGLFAAISNRILFGGISKHEGTPIEIATTFAADTVSLHSETFSFVGGVIVRSVHFSLARCSFGTLSNVSSGTAAISSFDTNDFLRV